MFNWLGHRFRAVFFVQIFPFCQFFVVFYVVVRHILYNERSQSLSMEA